MGRQISMRRQLSEIIKEIEDFVDEIEQKARAGRQAIELLRDMQLGADNNSPRYPGNRGRVNPADRLAPSRMSTLAGPGHYRKPKTVRGGKPPSSQFKGVRKCKKGYADGRPLFYASFRNPKTKKQEHLGSFDNEYLAGAAWFERAGDKKKARELRDMAEQANNNPDRPGSSKKKIKIWVCKRCGIEYKTDPEGHCIHCGNDDFREIEK